MIGGVYPPYLPSRPFPQGKKKWARLLLGTRRNISSFSSVQFSGKEKYDSSEFFGGDFFLLLSDTFVDVK